MGYITMDVLAYEHVEWDKELHFWYENVKEPIYCRLCHGVLKADERGNWYVASIAYWDVKKGRYVGIMSCFAQVLRIEIMWKVLYAIQRGYESRYG